MERISLRQRIGLDIFNGKVLPAEADAHNLQQIFWECTLRCNMHCRHCGSDCKLQSGVQDMPFEDFERVLKRVSEAYDPHYISIVVSGGEPLVRQDLEQCGRRMYDMEFPWGVVSNGLLMTDSRIDSLLGAGLRAATISLDGLEEDHVWMRGVPDAFVRASHAIERLAAEPSIGFDVVTCANKRNLKHLDELKEYLISIGLKQWRIFTVFPMGRAASDAELCLSTEEYRSLMDFIIRTKKEGRIGLNYGCEGFLGPYEGRVRDHLFSCQAGISVAGVRVDGSITACTSIRSDFDQGNIYQDDFVDVWENRFQVMRDRSWAKTGECADCKFWKWCHGNGLHLRDGEHRLLQCNLHRLGFTL